jgi:hypothetical protein
LNYFITNPNKEIENDWFRNSFKSFTKIWLGL